MSAWFLFHFFFHLFVWFVSRKRTFVSIFGLSHRHTPRKSRDSGIWSVVLSIHLHVTNKWVRGAREQHVIIIKYTKFIITKRLVHRKKKSINLNTGL